MPIIENRLLPAFLNPSYGYINTANLTKTKAVVTGMLITLANNMCAAGTKNSGL